MWIDGGQVRQNGNTHEVVGAYEWAMARGDSNGHSQDRRAGTKGRFLKWEIAGPLGGEPHVLTSMGQVTVKFTVQINEPIENGHHGIALFNHDRQLIWGWANDGVKLNTGENELRYTFPMLPVRPGPYTWLVSLYDEGIEVDAWECLPEMIVATEIHQHQYDSWNGVLNVPAEFTVAVIASKLR